MNNSENRTNANNTIHIDNKNSKDKKIPVRTTAKTQPRYGLPVGSKAVLGSDNKIIPSAHSGAKKTKNTYTSNIIHNSTEEPVEIKHQAYESVENKNLPASVAIKNKSAQIAVINERPKEKSTGTLALLKSEKTKTVSVRADAKEKKPFPLFSVLTIVFVCILLMFVIIDYVQIFENESMVNELKREFNSMKDEESRLSEELERKNDILYISEYASEKLGMVGSENHKSVYIDLSEEDSIQGYEPSNTDYGAIATVMDALGESAKAWIGIFGK